MVEFHFQSPVTLANRKPLKLFLQQAAKEEGFHLNSLSIVFCSDQYLLTINKEYLKHHDFTDIITFDYSGEKGSIHGELYVSVTRVRENSRAFGVSLQSELHRVIFHGLMHLCGYSDKTPGEKKIMRAKEDYYLSKYFGRST